MVVGRIVGGPPTAHLVGREQLVRHIVLECAAARTADDRAVGRADHQSARLMEERAFRLALQLLPKLVRATDQRHVERVLEVRLADDARATVRRTERVWRRELVDAERADAAAGELVERRAPHGAQADDDDVEHWRYLLSVTGVRAPRDEIRRRQAYPGRRRKARPSRRCRATGPSPR